MDRHSVGPGGKIVVVAPRPAGLRDKIVVLTVGRLHPRKGQLRTLEALQMLVNDYAVMAV